MSIICRFILIICFAAIPALSLHAAPSSTTLEDALKMERNLKIFPQSIQEQTKLEIAETFLQNNIHLDRSMQYARECLENEYDLENAKNQWLVIRSHAILGSVYGKYKNYELAADELKKANSLLRPWHKPTIRFRVINNLAEVLYLVDEYGDATKFSNQALKIAIETNDTAMLISCYENMAFMALNMDKLDTARHYTIKKLNYTKTLTDSYNAYADLAKIEHRKRNYQQSFEYSKQAITLAKQTNDDKRIAKATINYALYAALAGHFDDAERQLRVVGKMFDLGVIKDEELRRTFVDYGATVYDLRGDHKTALGYLRTYVLSTNILEKQKEQEFIKLLNEQVHFIDQKKELDVLLLSNKLKAENAKKIQLRFWFIVILLLTLIIISIYIIFSQIEKAENQAVIERQNVELTRKKFKDDLRKLELKAIMANLDGQEFERARIAKELHDGVGGAIAGIKFELESLMRKNQNKNLYDNVLSSIGKVYTEVRSISRNLSIPNFEGVSFEDNLQSLLNDVAIQGNIKIRFNKFPKEKWPVVPYTIQKEIYRVTQEALTNILKHSGASTVDVQIIMDKETITETIEDNGKGFDIHSKKTGIGLKNMKSRILNLKGTMNIDTGINQGTFIEFSVPLNEEAQENIRS